MNSKNAKDLKSTDVQPAKPGGKKGYHCKRQISQIPGLSPVITVSDERNFGKRVGVLDSDSEYIKLAKQGGHKGLLYFDNALASKPETFNSAEVLADGPIEALGNLNVICTKERKSPTTSQRPLPPFWTDNMSTWERDGGSPLKDKNKKVHDKQVVLSQMSPPNNGGIKFRRTVSIKKTSPVNMSKLLSFGYVDEDKTLASETESESSAT
ncbi:uncharacterized protein C7orf57-like isoform X1 [Stigmatopora argus]